MLDQNAPYMHGVREAAFKYASETQTIVKHLEDSLRKDEGTDTCKIPLLPANTQVNESEKDNVLQDAKEVMTRYKL